MLSVVSWFVFPFNATYCASKHAALALTEGVRIQLKSQGTQVVAVYAGFIDTDMAASFDREKTPPRQVAERTLDGIRNGLNDVHADERSEAIWQAVKNDPAGLHAQMQQQWDERGIDDDPFVQDPDTSNTSE
jgi:NAD(P)-dependent dehydrogenase (short-subunit alcohol dehydrogenase family)